MRNKEDQSNSWDQEIVHKLMTYMPSKFIKKCSIIHTTHREGNGQGQQRAKSM